MLLKSFLTLSTGGLCTVSFWLLQESDSRPVQDRQVQIEVRAAKTQDGELDPERMLHELKDLRVQLLATVGENHPATRTIDARIMQLSARGAAMAETLLATRAAPPASLRGTAVYDFARSNAGFGVEGGTLADVSTVYGVANGPAILGVDSLPATAITWGVPGMSGVPGTWGVPGGPTELGRKTSELRQKWEAVAEPAQRDEVVGELRQAIAQQFDADLDRRRQQVAELETKLQQLRQQIEKRESKRDDFVEVLTRHTEMEWEGISLPSGQRTRVLSSPPPAPVNPDPPRTAR